MNTGKFIKPELYSVVGDILISFQEIGQHKSLILSFTNAYYVHKIYWGIPNRPQTLEKL